MYGRVVYYQLNPLLSISLSISASFSMQRITNSLAVATNLWREYRWYHAKNMTDEEAMLVATVIGDPKTPREPWNRYLQSESIICDLFRRPGSHIIMLLRMVSKPMLCVYVPSASEVRNSPYVFRATSYYGRTSYAAWGNSSMIHSINLVMRRDDESEYTIWMTDPQSMDFSHSFADLLVAYVKPSGAYCFRKKAHPLTSEVYDYASDCTIEWFTTN